jgi:hypothetical protein
MKEKFFLFFIEKYLHYNVIMLLLNCPQERETNKGNKWWLTQEKRFYRKVLTLQYRNDIIKE